jgi:PKD repeat protein
MLRLRILLLLVLTGLMTGDAQELPLLRLQGGAQQLAARFDRASGLVAQLPDALPGTNRSWAWLQFERALEAGELEVLRASGIELLGYVQDHCYYVAIPRNIPENPLRELPVHSLSALLPAHILHPSLVDLLRGSGAEDGRKLDLQVMPHTGLDPRILWRELARAGFRPAEEPGQEDLLRLVIPATRLGALAASGLLRHIAFMPPPGEPEDRNGRAMHRANLIDRGIGGQGLAFDGSGVNVLVRDDGRIGPHIDFLGRLNQDYCLGPESQGTHGDMVSGILTGAGNLNPDVAGMATGAMLYTENYNGEFNDFTQNLIQNENIRVTNSSYSDGCNAGYTGRAARTDRQIWEDPLLMHVFSAGNAGTSNCDYGAGPFWGNITGGHKAGKNSIATANLFSDFNLVPSSSRGPLHDGRLKPDLAAHGQGQLSTFPNHTIDAGGGTSAAAPGVAGVMAQLSQAFRHLHGAEPASALLKASLLNSATDMGQPGPDFLYGWGHLNAWQAWRLLEGGQYQKLFLQPGEAQTVDIDIPDGLHELRVMLYWADPPALPQASVALVQDFELRVSAPGAPSPSLPLVLDHSPDPFLLAQPATPGEDHLNNVEQVRFAQPEAGTYQVQVQGLQLPFGSAEAWLVWSLVERRPFFAFPAGGESLHPGQSLRVYWEAPADEGPWSLEFSADSGQTWLPLQDDIPAFRRFADIEVPQEITANGYFRLTRGPESSTQDSPFRIFPRPANLRVARACPDSIAFTWDPVPDAEAYLVYQPGVAYMEVSLQTDTALAVIPTWNPLSENWLAVQARGEGDRSSPRTIARNHRSGLLQCRQQLDAKVSHLVGPPNLSVSGCEPTALDLILSIRNDGLQALSDLPVVYQLEDQDPVADILSGNLNAGAQRFFKFNKPPVFSVSGPTALKVWTDLDGDQFRYNDTLYLVIQANIENSGSLTPDFVEDFEQSDSLPLHWRVQASAAADRSWQPFVIDYWDGSSTRAMVMPNFFFDQIGNEDYLITPQVDLSGATKPLLLFDVAYSGYFGSGPDTLEIEILADCKDEEAQTVWSKTGSDLITTNSWWNVYTPESPEDWREESLDLSPWAGSKILIRFRNRAGYGNNLWLDNIRVTELSPQALLAGIALERDTACLGEEFLFADASLGNPEAWQWDFGTDADPPTAEGAGPHAVRYGNAGWKSVSLTVSRAGQSDTTGRMLPVLTTPQADFNAVASGDTLYLQSLALGASQWRWQSTAFGNQQGATLALPKGAGWPDSLIITHIAENLCGADSLTRILLISSLNGGNMAQAPWRIHPNPGRGLHYLDGQALGGTLWLEALDLQGRVIWSHRAETPAGPARLELDTASWPSGTYYLRISGASRYMVLPVVVE